jgi:hypothetical protein
MSFTVEMSKDSAKKHMLSAYRGLNTVRASLSRGGWSRQGLTASGDQSQVQTHPEPLYASCRPLQIH